MPDSMSHVRIIAVPPGEAPLWVREKWVGLELPLLKGTSVRTRTGFGVVSAPRTFWAQGWAILRGRADRVHGFCVDALSALEILEQSSPEAAAWWRENTGHLFKKPSYFSSNNKTLMFHAEVCEPVAS